MDKTAINKTAFDFTQESSLNFITADAALRPEYTGMKIFEAPLLAFGAAGDAIYNEFKSESAIGGHFLSPAEWLPNAKTVISLFLPFTERVRSANSMSIEWPAEEWLHGRIEGQNFMVALCNHLKDLLEGAGYESLIPLKDKRFKSGNEKTKFTSNWSERHAAFACGLGTFGLSRGLITSKGMCGRFGSIITELDLPADKRPYNGIYEYCNMCGLCVAQCPVHDISIEKGREFIRCSEFLDGVLEKHKPRYGCGKCQVNVPCESGIPKQ